MPSVSFVLFELPPLFVSYFSNSWSVFEKGFLFSCIFLVVGIVFTSRYVHKEFTSGHSFVLKFLDGLGFM